MRLEALERRRGTISMTSLIDVIFLLLLFFMLSSTFAKYGEIELTGAGSADENRGAPVYLKLAGDRLLLNGQELDLPDVAATLARQAEKGAGTILLSLDDKTASQRFVDVYTALKAVPGFAVAVVH